METSAARAPVDAPALGPRATPATTAMTVTGWTFGTAANNTRPAAAAAASVAISTSSLLEPGPDSSHAAPATITAAATIRSASAASSGRRAVQAAAASAAETASPAASLGKNCLPFGHRRDDAVRDGRGEHVVVRRHESRAAGRL